MRVAPQTRRPARQTAQWAHVPAPTGGLNTVSPASAMPAGDCPSLVNFVSGEKGQRVRLGWREWCTGLGSPAEEVRSILHYKGGAKSGANDRVFACTTSGIWDVSASSATPTRVLAFASSTADSGYGVACAFINSAGRYLLYTDEEHGYHVYTEASDSWVKVVPKATANWAAATAYNVGDYVLNDGGKTYVCDTAGTSAGAGGPTGTGSNIADNTARWDYVQHVLDGVAPANLAFVTVHKNRVMLVQKDTGSAWYLGTDAIFGAVTEFRFGRQFRSGGHLVGLWRWTLDAGAGMDDHLAAISSGGDVVVYKGTDISSASAWALVGTWSVGGVPSGRRIANEYGGDVGIVSSLGLVPLSQLVAGTLNPTQLPTAKVANRFNALVGSYKGNKGWALVQHPEENALLVLVPVQSGAATQQLAMSLATRGWSPFEDLPLFSAEACAGKLYAGTVDGRVLVVDGYVDGVTLAAPTVYTPVQWRLLTSFQNLGNARQKQVGLIRPRLLTQGAAPSVSVGARYDFDLSDLPTVSGSSGASASNAWDTGVWDTAVWGGEYAASGSVSGGAGMGTHVAIALRGTSNGRTELVGVDVSFVQGGFL